MHNRINYNTLLKILQKNVLGVKTAYFKVPTNNIMY